MDYKSLMGYGKKKKIIKEKPKPKVNKILESVKKEFGYINEGPAGEYELYISKIQDSYDEYWDSVKDFQKFLDKKGLRKESRGIGNSYKNLVLKFHKLLGKIVGKLQ